MKSISDITCISEELKENIIKIFGEKLRKLILFGSQARGDSDSESDIDYIAIIDEDEKELKKYRKQVVDLEVELDLKYDVVTSVILDSYEKYNKYLNVIPFYSNLKKEGIEIYGH